MNRHEILNQLFDLADTTDDAKRAKTIISNFRGTKDEIYDLYDIFESSTAFRYIQPKLARL
jgi:hypothetical protein